MEGVQDSEDVLFDQDRSQCRKLLFLPQEKEAQMSHTLNRRCCKFGHSNRESRTLSRELKACLVQKAQASWPIRSPEVPMMSLQSRSVPVSRLFWFYCPEISQTITVDVISVCHRDEATSPHAHVATSPFRPICSDQNYANRQTRMQHARQTV